MSLDKKTKDKFLVKYAGHHCFRDDTTTCVVCFSFKTRKETCIDIDELQNLLELEDIWRSNQDEYTLGTQRTIAHINKKYVAKLKARELDFR